MKIEENPSNPRYITTIWGYGYKWCVDELLPQASSAGKQTGVKGFGKTHDDS